MTDKALKIRDWHIPVEVQALWEYGHEVEANEYVVDATHHDETGNRELSETGLFDHEIEHTSVDDHSDNACD